MNEGPVVGVAITVEVTANGGCEGRSRSELREPGEPDQIEGIPRERQPDLMP
ncbi:MAG: hypothetical protein ACK55I_21785 [bacterium]